ncbi:secretory subunit [Dermatophagoides farinae]|uniref:Secretory subunit n=1 Tax=Dermatophagoides farinae TaxID=6954 RepID=A0A922I5W7_DERFA|nr:translocation protein SEC63 homolog [Dermatophagoides farinae]KAH9521848.1 secretory subunit [Dermatophagoides farinae]
MAGTKFQYDESGTTFYYFVLAFLTMILAPCTYLFWPCDKDKDDVHKERKSAQSIDNNSPYKQRFIQQCRCEPCLIKEHYMKLKEPSRTVRKRLTKIVLIVSWIGLIVFAYKVSEIQPDYVTFDPFEILGIDPQSSSAEIKKAYRRLSLIYHPDKETGDEKKFMKITKAYAALTDEQARKNWEEYGNPDGPGAMSFGIALPSWIVEKENSVFVLMVYVLMLMIVLPVCVRIWWSNSSKYGDFKVLLDTSQLYLYYINKSPQMMLRRVLMVICASLEFDKSHNGEIQERPADNVEIPKLMKQIPNLAMNNKERPLCFEYSLKARTLMYSHLLRISLPSMALEQDKKYILSKIPYLIQEFVQCSSQLTFLYLSRRIARCPSLDTMENAMKMNALVVQAMWSNKNSMLQLPHITEDMLRYFINRRRNIRNMQQLASLPNEDRRQMLARLNDEQYCDLLNVLGRMPLLDVDVRSEVIDDEDTATITAGALVTVFVKLTRQPMSKLFKDLSLVNENNTYSSNHLAASSLSPAANSELVIDPDEQDENKSAAKKSSKPWEKQSKGKKKAKPKKKQPLRQRQNQQRSQQQQQQKGGSQDGSKVKQQHSEENVSENCSDNEAHHHHNHSQENSGSESDSDAKESEPTTKRGKESEEPDENEESVARPSAANNKTQSNDDNDDDDWSIVKQNLPKKEIFKAVSKMSHSVHCPYYPEDKQEHWWIYITDRKKMSVKTIPYFMTNLVDREEVELKFMAPQEPGSYQYMVNVRCDSYVDMDYFKTLKLDVKEAPKEIVSHPQWEMSEEEDDQQPEDDSAASDSDLIASDDDDDEDIGDNMTAGNRHHHSRHRHDDDDVDDDDDDDYDEPEDDD